MAQTDLALHATEPMSLVLALVLYKGPALSYGGTASTVLDETTVTLMCGEMGRSVPGPDGLRKNTINLI